jgi:DNA-binding SARP family transcriptional activator
VSEESQRQAEKKHEVPLLRVYLLQGCRLEWAGVPAEQEAAWHRRTSARALFILLACAPQRQASRSQIASILWPETDEEKARESLRSALKCLREVFRSGRGEDLLEARGDLLTLKGQEHLWIDIDAIADLARQARNSPTPHEALPLWEQARALLHGELLAEERTSEWSQCPWIKVRRKELRAARRAMIRALSDFYVQSGQQGQAEELLHAHVIRFPTDQDALYRLMKLLIQAESFEEARSYYEQCKVALAALGKQPARSLRALAESLSAQSRELHMSWQAEQIRQEPTTLPIKEQNRESGQIVDRREAVKHIGSLSLAPFVAPHALLGIQSLEQHKSLPNLFSSDEVMPETLHHFAILTDLCRNLSEGNELKTAEKILWSYLPRVESLVRYMVRRPQEAASIASQGYLLAASLAGHRHDLQARLHYSEQALLYGEIAQDDTLQVAAFRQLAATFNYLGLPHKVMQTYQRALPHVDNVPPLLRSCIYAALSGVCAQFQQKQDAYHFIGLAHESFGAHQGDEPDFLRAINASQNLLIHWEGKNHLLLGQPSLAEKVFLQLDVLDPQMKLPKRIRAEAINNRAIMFIAVGNMEQACLYLESAVKIAAEIGSSLRLQETSATFHMLKRKWQNEKCVQALGDLFIQYLVHQV